MEAVLSQHRFFLRAEEYPDPASFCVGRDAELCEIESLLLDTDKNIVISGPRGIGKTHIALTIAHKIKEKFIGGIFFSNGVMVEELSELWELLTECELDGRTLLIVDDAHLINSNAPQPTEIDKSQHRALILSNFINSPSNAFEKLATNPLLKIIVCTEQYSSLPTKHFKEITLANLNPYRLIESRLSLLGSIELIKEVKLLAEELLESGRVARGTPRDVLHSLNQELKAQLAQSIGTDLELADIPSSYLLLERLSSSFSKPDIVGIIISIMLFLLASRYSEDSASDLNTRIDQIESTVISAIQNEQKETPLQALAVANVNLRTKPAKDHSDILLTIKKGTVVRVVTQSGEWLLVKLTQPGEVAKRGWVHREYFRLALTEK